MSEEISVALIGMGGYGNGYVDALLDSAHEHKVNCIAMVDPNPAGCRRIDEVNKRGIPVYSSIEEVYENCSPKLVFIASPIQFHCEQTCYALEHGSHVMCEKPISATTDEAIKMMNTSSNTGRFVGIGYQWSYSAAMQKAKRDIMKGLYGRPKNLKTLILWPRSNAYYSRDWAGKIKSGDKVINDSIVNNACAHYLHNMYFVLGSEINKSTFPKRIMAECYRAYDIENFDTITAKIVTDDDVDIFFAASHATDKLLNPIFHYEFSNGVLTFGEDRVLRGTLKNNTNIEYGGLSSEPNEKMWAAVEAVRGADTLCSDLSTAYPHTLTVNYIQKNIVTQDFPNHTKYTANLDKGNENNLSVCVKGLTEALIECYKEEQMLSSKFKGLY